MRNCPRCEQVLEESDFYKSGDKIQRYCKNCFNSYIHLKKKQRKIKAIEYKGGQCTDCNIAYPATHPAVFDFHHIDPTAKDMDWGKMSMMNWERIANELDKCILLCSNCHRVRHAYFIR